MKNGEGFSSLHTSGPINMVLSLCNFCNVFALVDKKIIEVTLIIEKITE
jgi:hypothetical protein